MQRIHQDACIGRIAGRVNQLQRRAHVGDSCPGHELQVGCQSEGLHQFTQAGVAVGQARRVGVVSGDQDTLGLKGGADFKQGQVGFCIKTLAHADDFKVEHLNAVGLLDGEGFAQGIWLVDQVLLGCAGHVGQQPKTDLLVTGVGR